MSEKMSVTRALVELKQATAKINGKVSEARLVGVYRNRDKVEMSTRKPVADFEKMARSQYDSVVDDITRAWKIKRALVKSNGETVITVNGNPMTVAEAIWAKDAIAMKRQLLMQFRQQLQMARNQVEANDRELTDKVQKMLEANAGIDKKSDPQAYENIAKPFLDANSLMMLDPLNAEERIRLLLEDVEGFEKEVDFCLSESNSSTFIEI